VIVLTHIKNIDIHVRETITGARGSMCTTQFNRNTKRSLLSRNLRPVTGVDKVVVIARPSAVKKIYPPKAIRHIGSGYKNLSWSARIGGNPCQMKSRFLLSVGTGEGNRTLV
jgi:hypothetical protein